MNRIQRNKLVLSKWTAVVPTQSEKHFIVTRVIDEPPEPMQVVLEAVHSKREFRYPWTDLKDDTRWCQGWR
ncbi:MAG: TIGR02450 family Trp-rich protein [Myxococcota bacterium]|nr:TIGR02450 family Trp-rich protein [Myxococcota bacterium]